MTARRSVAIIGAGLAGTSAALGFLDAGFDVTLYSDRDRESLRDKVPPTGVGVLFGKSREWDAEIIEDLYEVSNTTGIVEEWKVHPSGLALSVYLGRPPEAPPEVAGGRLGRLEATCPVGCVR